MGLNFYMLERIVVFVFIRDVIEILVLLWFMKVRLVFSLGLNFIGFFGFIEIFGLVFLFFILRDFDMIVGYVVFFWGLYIFLFSGRVFNFREFIFK